MKRIENKDDYNENKGREIILSSLQRELLLSVNWSSNFCGKKSQMHCTLIRGGMYN